MIKQCKSCSSKPHSQDELHGKGKRVFNEHFNKNKAQVLRCTRCGHEEVHGQTDKKDGK